MEAHSIHQAAGADVIAIGDGAREAKGGDVSLLGHLVWFSVSELEVKRDDLLGAIGDSGLGERFAPGEITELPQDGRWIIATGPLTAPGLAESIASATGKDALAFFDAIAPIVHAETIDFDIAWRQSRYDKEGPGGDAAAYVNCPMGAGEGEDVMTPY